MAKSAPTSFDPTEGPKTPKVTVATNTTKALVDPAHARVEYPGQTLGIVALSLSLFAQIPALAMGIVAWVWSNNAGKNNIPAKISVYVSAALIVIGTFFFAWIVFIGSGWGSGFDRDGDHRFQGGPMPVQVMPGHDGMMHGHMDDMMLEYEGEMEEGDILPTPYNLPSGDAVTD